MEGLKEWLDAVSTARIPSAVVSSLNRRIVIEVLESMGLMKYFQVGGDKDEYTDTDMDEIREEWAGYVSNFIFRKSTNTGTSGNNRTPKCLEDEVNYPNVQAISTLVIDLAELSAAKNGN